MLAAVLFSCLLHAGRYYSPNTSNMTTTQGSQSSSNGDVVVQAKAPSGKLGSLSAMTKNSEGYGTHNRGKKQMMISAERKMAPRFLFGVFLTIFM
jgi:hypothetical protein